MKPSFAAVTTVDRGVIVLVTQPPDKSLSHTPVFGLTPGQGYLSSEAAQHPAALGPSQASVPAFQPKVEQKQLGVPEFYLLQEVRATGSEA